MIGTVNATVTDVQPRIVKEGKPDQKTIYDVVDQAGEKFTAWEKQLAEAAYHLKGQPSIWKVKVEQNGSYTNRTLMEITPAGSGNAMMAQATQTFPEQKMQIDPNAKLESVNFSPTEKDTNIHRQTATKVAAALNPASETDFWSTVLSLISFYETGVLPVKQGQAVAPQASEPDFMSPFAPVPDDEIPF